jgi:hypothetical protein
MLTSFRSVLPLACAVWLTAGSALAADVKITDEARKHFNAGVALLRDPDGARYEEAYREFKVAYEASPSWKILGNLGLAAMKLERDGEAIAAFERYLSEAKGLEASERADVERDLNTLRASTVSVTLTTTPAVVTILDERMPVQGSPVRNRYQSQAGSLKLQVRPGHHAIQASVDGKPPIKWEFDAEPGSTHTHDFNLDAPPATDAAAPPPAPAGETPAPTPGAVKSRPVPASVWVGVAATGVFAIGAGVTGAMALGKNAEYEKANGQDPVKAKSLHDDTKTMNLVTDVLIGAAVVSAGITTYLFVKRPERETGVELRVGPHFGMRETGLSLRGSF